ncbi:hypothetical protein KJ359_012779 [Pestalotiopsis sp. 9143b]|nr:hypothetical protein KJ359_012779 [Pestalotiopsis sp. 9143b]
MPPTVDNSTIAADGRMNAPPVGALNPRLRPQRLFQKVQVAMEIAKKKIKDSNQVTISEWISEPDMERFLLAVRGIVRKNLDAAMDSWPKQTPHDYLPDVRQAIVETLNEGIRGRWTMFEVSPEWDDFVAEDFLRTEFYIN